MVSAMKAIILTLILSTIAFGATHKGRNIDGVKFSASTRINGRVESVFVRFDGRSCELWLKGKILPMKLESEEIDDPAAVIVYDAKREFLLKVDLD